MVAMLTAFVVVSAVLTIIPGPDLMFILRTSAHGRGPAVAAALGAAAAALLRSSADAFETVKLAGAAYLIFLGLRTLRQSRKTRQIMTAARPATATGAGRNGAETAGQADTAAAEAAAVPMVSARRAFAVAAGIDLFNPKTGLFYVAVLPQVIPHDVPALRSTLLFAGVDSLVAAGLFTGVACAAAALIGWLRRPGFVRGLELTTGLSMVGIGIRTAIERT
jgi:threonine/homoserine/homoserine lactone efflux protein